MLHNIYPSTVKTRYKEREGYATKSFIPGHNNLGYILCDLVETVRTCEWHLKEGTCQVSISKDACYSVSEYQGGRSQTM